jgi:hypothetical protein
MRAEMPGDTPRSRPPESARFTRTNNSREQSTMAWNTTDRWGSHDALGRDHIILSHDEPATDIVTSVPAARPSPSRQSVDVSDRAR